MCPSKESVIFSKSNMSTFYSLNVNTVSQRRIGPQDGAGEVVEHLRSRAYWEVLRLLEDLNRSACSMACDVYTGTTHHRHLVPLPEAKEKGLPDLGMESPEA
jgi:hypothetical protein